MQIKSGVKLREFGDAKATWDLVKSNVRDGFQKRFPLEGRNVRLVIDDVNVSDKRITKKDQHEAKRKNLDLTVPVTGTYKLYDKETNKLIARKKMSLGRLPYLTPEFGTLIGNGTDFSVATQMRLRPGAYTRVKANNEIETQFNTQGGAGFRVSMEPETGVFRLNVGSNRLKLYPILKKLGVKDDELKKEWGSKLYDVNVVEDKGNFDKFYKRMLGRRAVADLSDDEKREQIMNQFSFAKLTPEIMQKNIGVPYKNVTPEAILRSSGKILRVSKGDESPDDRDSLSVKTFHGIEDFLREKIEKDSGGIAHKLLFKLDQEKTLDKVPAGYFTSHFKSLIKGDDRVATPEGINPMQLYDLMHKNVLLGEGGVGSTDMITQEARAVNPSQIGMIDPIRGPESEKIGIDTWAARNTYKGSDKKIYARFINKNTGKEEYLSPEEAEDKVIALPMEIHRSRPAVMHKGRQKVVKRKKVDYFIKRPSEMFSTYLNMVPAVSATQGNRALMAGKAMGDTLPLVNPEAPWVRSEGPDGDFETHYGKKVLTRMSDIGGEVKKITKNEIVIKGDDGKTVSHDIYNMFPISKKTDITHQPIVQVGDKVKPGQIIAKSNFTDNNGTVSVGKHLRAAFIPLRGNTFEDGIVVSESAAKKMTSDHMYEYEVPLDENTTVDKKKYVSYFPSVYKKDQTANFENNGLPKVGTKLRKKDPIIIGMKRRVLTPDDIMLGKIHKSLRRTHDDISIQWDHEDEGEVVDTVVNKGSAKVYIKAKSPLKIGDKLTGRYGNKGVISEILPDSEMPVIKRTGKPLDMALNSMGIISRINPAQIVSGVLGKIGEEKGKIYRLPNFSEDDYIEFAKKELKKHNIPAEEMLLDPKTGKPIKAFVSNPYFYKLSKLAETMSSEREIAGYTSNLQPAKGKNDMGKAKRFSTMEISALLGHNAKHNLRDITSIKGNKNDEYWKMVRLGMPPKSPGVPFVYDKFFGMLQAAGANISKDPNRIGIKPLTDKDTVEMSHGEIKNGRLINARTLEPEKGGLFDFALTGGVTGKRWTHVNLGSEMPNPLMEKPISSLLDMKQGDVEKVISGEKDINGITGGKAIKKALSNIDVDKEIENQRQLFQKAPKSKKDKIAKKLMYLTGIKNSGISPDEMVIKRVPILPPVYRPVSMMEGKDAAIVSDANILYRDMMKSNEIYKDLKKELPEEMLGEERLSLYKNLKASSGMGEPVNIKTRKKGIKGFMKKIVGDQPKSGFFFDKVVAKTQDLVGRAVAVPDSSLGIDELGIPEKTAWQIYKPFVQRDLVRKGMPAVKADEEIMSGTHMAKESLNKVMNERPVLMNRAPTLWKYGVMSFWPKLRKDKTIATSPMIEGPFGLDHDGDALQLHVPVSEEARIEAIDRMMPSKNLFNIKDRNVHYVPTQEDVFGLYLASKDKGKGKVRKFKNAQEVQAAIAKGEIDYNTPIEVG